VVDVFQVLRFIGQAPEKRHQAFVGGLGQHPLPGLSAFRNTRPFFEKEVDEITLAPPGRETEGPVSELVDGVTSAPASMRRRPVGACPAPARRG